MSNMDTNCTTSNASQFANSTYSIVSAVSVLVGFVSFLACIFTIISIILFKQYYLFNHRLVLYLAISATIFSLSVTIQRVDYQQETGTFYTNFCIFSGFFNQISSWMILDAVTSITLSLIIRAFFRRNPQTFDCVFVFFIFFFPFLFNWVPFIKSAYGKSGAWCWIRSMDENMCQTFKFGVLMQLLLWYVPLYAIILIQMVLFVLVIIKITHHKKYSMIDGYVPYNQTDGQETIKETVPMLAYPVIYFVINIFPFVNCIYEFVRPAHPSVALWFISGIFNGLIGLLITVAYLVDPQTRRKLNRANVKAVLASWCIHRRNTVYDYSIPADNSSDSLRRSVQQHDTTGNNTEHTHLGVCKSERHPNQKLSPKHKTEPK